MADYKRLVPGLHGFIVITPEEAAERKRFVPGDSLIIQRNVAAAATGVTPLVRGRFSLVAHHGMVA